MTRGAGSAPLRRLVVAAAALVAVAGCSFDVAELPLPGGAEVGDDPYSVTIEFADVLDLVPQSAVRVDDIAVGRVTDIELDGWSARVTVLVNGDTVLPDDAVATIRQSSLLGEKFVSLAPPAGGGSGRLSDGDSIGTSASGRNPEVEEVLGAASLLFNGGGIEKTNTIVKELNATLGGNEAEVKELLTTTSTFLGTLDDNKDQILRSLEQVNDLAVAANGQRGAITGALDQLPEALRVLDGQRDDLVRLTDALHRLGDTATGVIQQTRDDTVANLRSLEPILANLTTASDDLIDNLSTLLTFPFADAAVGGSLAAVQAPCSNAVPTADSPRGCGGDYLNLSVNLDLSAEQLCNLIGPSPLPLPIPTCEQAAGGLAALGGGGQPELPTAEPAAPEAAAGAADLVQFFDSLLGAPTTPPADGAAPVASPDAATPSAAPSTGSPPATSAPGLCTLLRLCRPAPAPTFSDLGRLILSPAVAP